MPSDELAEPPATLSSKTTFAAGFQCCNNKYPDDTPHLLSFTSPQLRDILECSGVPVFALQNLRWPSPNRVSGILNDALESCALSDVQVLVREELVAVLDGLREWRLKDIFAQGQVNFYNISKKLRGPGHSAYLLMVLEHLRRTTVLVLMDSEQNISPEGEGVNGTLLSVRAEDNFAFHQRLKIGDKIITYSIEPDMTPRIQGLIFDRAEFASIPVFNWKWDYTKRKGAPGEL